MIERTIIMKNNLIYFLSPHHNRSVVAQSWAEKLHLNHFKFYSSGWSNGYRDSFIVQAMRELNIDISQMPSNQMDEELLEASDFIIAIYDFHKEKRPPIKANLKKKLIEWHVPSPCGENLFFLEDWSLYQEVCDHVAIEVKKLENVLSQKMNYSS